MEDRSQEGRKHVFAINGSPAFLDVVRVLFREEAYNVTTANFVPNSFAQDAPPRRRHRPRPAGRAGARRLIVPARARLWRPFLPPGTPAPARRPCGPPPSRSPSTVRGWIHGVELKAVKFCTSVG